MARWAALRVLAALGLQLVFSFTGVQGENWRRTTIQVLPVELLLEIFDFYRLDAMEQTEGRPWKWHRLAHVCRKWRDVVFGSPRRLGLRIFCEYGAPIGRILASLPTLPLVAKFNGGPKSKNIPRNVMVALRRPDRLCEIDLHVKSSLLPSIVQVIQKPCRELESVRITVQYLTGPSILVSNAFLGGSAPHLREIKLDGIAFPFPSIQQVLLSTKNLVELHLGRIPNDAYFSPNDLVTGLSTLLQLRRLTVDFQSPASSPLPSMTHQPPQRITLRSLTFLRFHGASGYLEEFVAQINSPALNKIAIKLFNDIFFGMPEFCKFISRPNALRSPAWVFVRHNLCSVRVLFYDGTRHHSRQSELNEEIFVEILCRRLDRQLSFMTKITRQLSTLLSGVHSISIHSDNGLPTGEEDVDSTEWLTLFRPFIHAKQVYVRVDELVPGIMQALVAEDINAGVLPELTSLHLNGYNRLRSTSPSAADAAEQFVARRKLSGRTVTLHS